MKNKTKKALTLVELMIVIAIIGILSAIVLVGLGSARQRAKDVAVYTQLASLRAAVFKCAKRSYGTQGVIRVGYPASERSTCMIDSADMSNVPKWPVLVSSSGWAYGQYHWCNPDSNASPPVGLCDASINCIFSPDHSPSFRGTGKFCYIFSNGSKKIWCNHNGCGKNF